MSANIWPPIWKLDNRSATNSPDIITVSDSGPLVTKLRATQAQTQLCQNILCSPRKETYAEDCCILACADYSSTVNMKAVRFFETLGRIYHITRRHVTPH